MIKLCLRIPSNNETLSKYCLVRGGGQEPIDKKFILEDAYVFRNAFAHADYDLDVSKELITLGIRRGPKLDLSFDKIIDIIKTISDMYFEVSLVMRMYLFVDENLRKMIVEMLSEATKK